VGGVGVVGYSEATIVLGVARLVCDADVEEARWLAWLLFGCDSWEEDDDDFDNLL
jgi:hypothetical protein